MDTNRFTRIDATTWRIEPHGMMRVPAVIYADENVLRDMDDKVFEQAATSRPCSTRGAAAAADLHQGINGGAAMHIPHELPDEFPDETLLITRLMKTNYLFRRIAGRYDAVNRQISQIESEEEPAADEVLEKFKKERLKLKDQIALMFNRTERRM